MEKHWANRVMSGSKTGQISGGQGEHINAKASSCIVDMEYGGKKEGRIKDRG